jgi:hypothetical protein
MVHNQENSTGKSIEVKDWCEREYLLVDFHHQFIPTIGDFVGAMQDIPTEGLAKRLEKFHSEVIDNPKLSATLLSPLSVTGQLKSLLLTHNSWFISTILPMMGKSEAKFIDFDISPDIFFNPMQFELWMDNGLAVPPSAVKLQKLKTKFA